MAYTIISDKIKVFLRPAKSDREPNVIDPIMTPAMKKLIVLGDQFASSQIKVHSDSMESSTFVSNSMLEHVDFLLEGHEFRRMV